MNHYPFRKFITSSADLLEIVRRVQEYRELTRLKNHREICELYRGHGRSSWQLLPNLVRNIKDSFELKQLERKIVTDFHEKLTNAGFSKYIQGGFLQGQFHSNWLLIQQAQHYGVPTRFMDWTGDWEVALFFAVSNPKDDFYDGHFWIYIVQPEMFVADNNEKQYLYKNPFEFSETIFLNSCCFVSKEYLSKTAQRRKLRQKGRFCIQPYEQSLQPLESQDLHKVNLYPIIIPSYLKKQIRQELADKGITKESLYIEERTEINGIISKIRQKYCL